MKQQAYPIIVEPYKTEESWSTKMISSSPNKIITNTDTFFDLSEILNRLEE